MKRRRFLQLFGLSPAAVVLPVPAGEPDLLPADLHAVLADPNVAIEPQWIEPAADAPIWEMVTAPSRVNHNMFCVNYEAERPCRKDTCVCLRRMKEYVTHRM